MRLHDRFIVGSGILRDKSITVKAVSVLDFVCLSFNVSWLLFNCPNFNNVMDPVYKVIFLRRMALNKTFFQIRGFGRVHTERVCLTRRSGGIFRSFLDECLVALTPWIKSQDEVTFFSPCQVLWDALSDEDQVSSSSGQDCKTQRWAKASCRDHGLREFWARRREVRVIMKKTAFQFKSWQLHLVSNRVVYRCE